MPAGRNEQRRVDFEKVVTEKGEGVLDLIFGEGNRMRERVKVSNPGAWGEREIVLDVMFEDKKEVVEIIDVIAKWLKEGNNWDRLKEIMLF